ncbi:MAG: M24 family metallopeptidase [Pyramidobacter sp.]|jgi:Xaa-Pro aminopeptidase
MDFFDCLHKRIETLRGRLAEKDLDALVLIDDENAGWENLYYYSGFRGSSGVAVITHRQAILVTDSRYLTQASQQSCMEIRPVVTREKHTATFKRLMDELKLRRCGYDGEMLSAANYLELASLPVEWVDFSTEISAQRRSKDDYEIAQITQAAEIASTAYLETLPQVRVGMTELEFSKILELNIARHCGEGVWHKSKMIVASGTRSAMPHGVASTKPMELGDQVTVDYGAIYGGYMSDLTRNFSLGPVRDPEFNEIHEVLLKAHRDSAACLRPGAKGCDVHAVAQKVIADAGYGRYFGHGLGHSFGLEIHEMPHLSPSSKDILQPGDVVTIEPGIYIPDRGGLRVEDDYLITADGALRLSQSLPQEFVCLKV